MDTLKTYIKFALIKASILSLACFYGVIVTFRFIYSRFKHGPEYFRIKKRTLPPACLQNPAFKHSYIKLKDVKLHYVEAGDRSKPLILFVHGFPEFWFSWRHQLKYFAKNYWVVAYDQRGYGDSEKPSKVLDYTTDVLINDVVELVKGLGKEKCVLVGHDWGGIVAWYTAGTPRTTNVVEKLIILNAPHPAAFKKKIGDSLKQFLKSWYLFFFQLPSLPEIFASANDVGIFDRIFTKAEESPISSENAEILEAYKYTFSTRESWTPPLNYYRASFRVTNIASPVSSNLSRISQPTLIIWGEQDLALEPDFPELSMEYCTGPTEIQRIKNGNHFIQNHCPNDVNAGIEKFLAEN